MKYSIDYPDHELQKFIGQTFMRRSPLDRVRFGIISGVEKVYDNNGHPYELLIHLANNATFAFFNNSIELNNPNYTINGVPIGVKPNETQQALHNNTQNQQASRLERAIKKIHNHTEAPTAPTPPNPEPVKHYFEAHYSVDSWDAGHVTNLEHGTLLKISAKDCHDALKIACNYFEAPSRHPTLITDVNKVTARWYSDDACEELGSEITITIRPVN